MHESFPGYARRPWMAAALLLVSLGPSALSADQASKSAVTAAELVKALDAAKLDSIAAPDPSSPDAWVAALYFKDGQLLVVSAKYSASALFTAKLKTREYRDIYIDLQSASLAGTRVFIMDQAADGLVARPRDGGADTWEEKDKTLSFDGEWRKAKMSEAQYLKAFGDADDRYAKMLELLAAQVKSAKNGSN